MVLAGCLPVITQNLIPEITWSFCPMLGTVVGLEDSIRGRTGTESLPSKSLCSSREESCQTIVTEGRLSLILRTHPLAVATDSGVSNRMKLD